MNNLSKILPVTADYMLLKCAYMGLLHVISYAEMLWVSAMNKEGDMWKSMTEKRRWDKLRLKGRAKIHTDMEQIPISEDSLLRRTECLPAELVQQTVLCCLQGTELHVKDLTLRNNLWGTKCFLCSPVVSTTKEIVCWSLSRIVMTSWGFKTLQPGWPSAEFCRSVKKEKRVGEDSAEKVRQATHNFSSLVLLHGREKSGEWGGDKGERSHRGKGNGQEIWMFAKLNGALIILI